MKQAGRIYSQNLLELGLDDAEIPADPLLPDSALAGRRAALRPLDGIRGEPRHAPLRLRVHVGLARRPGRPAPRSSPDPPPGRSHL